MSRDAIPAAKVVLEDRYELVERLDDRGLGETWKARDPNFTTRLVMVKFLRKTPREGDMPDGLDAVVRRLRALRHPNLPQTLSSGLWGDLPYVVQAWFEGISLVAALEALQTHRRELPRAALENLVDQVCAALEALHGQDPPWVHGALHPGCVFVNTAAQARPEVRVLDVGLAPYAEGGTGFIYADCVAPEQRDGRAPSVATDVYALAMVARRALRESGEKKPWVEPFADYRGRADVPAAVWEVLERATRTNASERPGRVGELRAALQGAWRSSAMLAAKTREAPVAREEVVAAKAAKVVTGAGGGGAPPGLYDDIVPKTARAEAVASNVVAMALPDLVTRPTGTGAGAGAVSGDAAMTMLQDMLATPSLERRASMRDSEGAADVASIGFNPWSTEVLQQPMTPPVMGRDAEATEISAVNVGATEVQEQGAENPFATSVLQRLAFGDQERPIVIPIREDNAFRPPARVCDVVRVPTMQEHDPQSSTSVQKKEGFPRALVGFMALLAVCAVVGVYALWSR